MKKRRRLRKRRAVSGIISAAILFTILFSTGTTYFLYAINLNQQQQIASSQRARDEQLQKLEQFLVTGILVGNNIGFFVNNTGGVAFRIVNVFLSNSSYFKLMNSSNSEVSPRLPITINAGGRLDSFDTGVVPKSGVQYTMKVLTERGTIALGFYPLLTVPLATLALLAVVAQGSGYLALDFNSFRAYNTTGSGSGCNPSSPGCQLTPWPSGVPAYSLKAPKSTGRFVVFSANVTNIDPQKRTVTLDSDSVLVQFLTPKPGTGGGTASAWSWGIGRVNPSGVTIAWSTITVSYFQSVTIYFTQIPTPTVTQWPASGDFVAVFMYFHGSISSSPFGQNIPFVTTKYS